MDIEKELGPIYVNFPFELQIFIVSIYFNTLLAIFIGIKLIFTKISKNIKIAFSFSTLSVGIGNGIHFFLPIHFYPFFQSSPANFLGRIPPGSPLAMLPKSNNFFFALAPFFVCLAPIDI
jgi:hypothetical protein